MDIDPTATIRVDDLPPAGRALRIAVVTETYPPEVNGVSMTTARLVEGLVDRGHRIQLIRPRQCASDAPDDSRLLHQVLLRGLPIPRYPHLRMGMPARRELIGLWSVQRPDLVHIVTEGPLGWSALRASIRLRLPVCSDFRTNFHAYSRHYGVGWLHRPIVAYLRKFHNRTLCTMVPTEELARELAGRGFRRLQVVARGVDTRRFDPARRSPALRASWGCGPDTRVVLHVGRLAPEKNLAVLADAFEAMREVDRGLRLLLVGDGPAARELRARCPNAIFAGMRHGEDLAAHYASADAFVFPSLTETYGNVVPEAMASGLPVLAFDCAAASRLIANGHNGLLAPPGDAAAFRTQALRLAAEPGAAREMGTRARDTARSLDWDRIVGQVEAAFDSAIRAHALEPVGRRPSARPGRAEADGAQASNP